MGQPRRGDRIEFLYKIAYTTPGLKPMLNQLRYHRLVRWVRRLQSDFSPLVRNKGHRYFQGGAVRITAGAVDNVHALVKGSRAYTVHIRLNRDEVIAECDCPYYLGEDLCKHIWATLLAAESAGYLTR